MSKTSKSEYRAARRAILWTWLIVAFGSIGYFLVSIGVSIYFGPRARPRSTPVSRDDRLAHLRCNEEVGALFLELHTTAFAVQSALVPDYAIAVGRRWQQFSQGWTERWHELGERCRFDDLVDTGLGPGLDGTARAFHELADVQRIYAGLVRTMVERHSVRVANLRDELDKAHRQLEKAYKPAAQPAQSGHNLEVGGDAHEPTRKAAEHGSGANATAPAAPTAL